MGGKGYKPRKDYAGRTVSGDWEDSDRGAGNKATRRSGGKVDAKSPTYLAHVHNKGKKKVDPKKNPVVVGEMNTELSSIKQKFKGKMTKSSVVKRLKDKGESKREFRNSYKKDIDTGYVGPHKPSPSNLKTALKKQNEEVENVTEAGLGTAIKYGGKWAVRQGIKVGGKQGGYAVKKAGKAAAKGAVEVARETGRGAVEAAKKRGRQAGGDFVTNVGRPVAVDGARRTLKDDGKAKGGKQANESVAAPAKKPAGKGEKIGKVIGGLGGSIAGGTAGGIAGGGVASVATGVAGSLAGGEVGERIGGAIGKKFDKKKPTVKKESFSDWRNELTEAERKLADRLARKNKLYDKTTRKAMDDARRTGEASGHNRYRMGSLDREMDGIKARMKKESLQLGEEGYDRMRDKHLERGGIGAVGSKSPSRPYTRSEKQPKGKTVLQKETEKKYGKGVSALDVVKANIKSKYGKGAIYDAKKK